MNILLLLEVSVEIPTRKVIGNYENFFLMAKNIDDSIRDDNVSSFLQNSVLVVNSSGKINGTVPS